MRFFDSTGALSKEVTAVINEQGFRGTSVDPEKPPALLRIVAIGDSQTFGVGVAEGESWPAVLEETLRRSMPGSSIEVMNCAVPGYEAEQEEAALETRWLAFHPDLVLLGYFANDPMLQDVRLEHPPTLTRLLMRVVVPKGRGILAWSRRRSALVDFVLNGIYRRLLIREWASDAVLLHADGFEGWKRTRAALARESELCERTGARFGVILLPFPVSWGDGMISTEAYKTVAAYCAGARIPTFDPESCFADLDLKGMLVHERDPHSSSQVHRIEGEAIARWVLDRKFLR